MQLGKSLLILLIAITSFSSNAERKESQNLILVLAKYGQVYKKCSKYRGFGFELKTNNAWFNNLSEQDKKTVTYVINTDLNAECMKSIDDELIVAFFYDAAVTKSNEKLLVFLEMSSFSIPNDEDAVFIEEKIKKLDPIELDLFKNEFK